MNYNQLSYFQPSLTFQDSITKIDRIQAVIRYVFNAIFMKQEQNHAYRLALQFFDQLIDWLYSNSVLIVNFPHRPSMLLKGNCGSLQIINPTIFKHKYAKELTYSLNFHFWQLLGTGLWKWWLLVSLLLPWLLATLQMLFFLSETISDIDLRRINRRTDGQAILPE